MSDPKKLLQDMISALEAIENYSVSSFEMFTRDDKTQDAVMFNLVILGEAANRLPESIRNTHPEIPWASIIGTRNVIVHGYDQVKIAIVWDILEKDIQPLKTNLAILLQMY
jgi:uncharacterized protein with HEPN domain